MLCVSPSSVSPLMPTDGDIDYKGFTREQLEEALTRIDADAYPKKHQKLAAELATRPSEDIAPQQLAADGYAPKTLVGSLQWHALSKMIAVYGSAGVLASIVAALGAGGTLLALFLALSFLALIPVLVRGDAWCPGCRQRTMDLDWNIGSKIFHHNCSRCGARATNGALKPRGGRG
jgi:hypothetical protein